MTEASLPSRRLRISWLRRIFYYLREEWSHVVQLPQSRAGRLFFVIVFLVGVWLRVAGLDWGLSYKQSIGSPYHDEPHVMYFLTNPWESFKQEFHEYEIVRPVYMWRIIARPLFSLGERVGWNSEENLVFEYVVARGINSVLGILGLVVVYLLGVRLGGVRSGLLAMMLLTVMPGHWFYSQLLKGDLLVATCNSLLLLCAVCIYDRGTRFWYILAGLAAGFGIASKPSVVVIVPIVLLAHVLRALSLRRVRALVSSNALIAVVLASFVFFLLYPYPYLNTARWWKAFTEPSSQFFWLNWRFTPSSFLQTWSDYNDAPHVFMEMVFGEALRRAFPLTTAFFIALTLLAWRARKGVPFLLTALAALLVYHSLSFTLPLDDRYVLPLAPFVVLFPAVLAGAYPFFRSRWRVFFATSFVMILFVYTAGVTWATFPLFALGTDIRVAVVEFLEATVQPGDIVGEFEAGGRQSLPFDRSRVTTTRIRTHEDDPHIFLFGEPEYIVVPVEPENYDHAFRYQLHTPELRREFASYVKSFELVRRFGREPEIFGRKLPRMLSTPIFDVYRYAETRFSSTLSLLAPLETWRTSEGGRRDPREHLIFDDPLILVQDRQLSASDLSGKLLTFIFDISDLEEQRRREALSRGVFMPFFIFDGDTTALIQSLPVEETDITFMNNEGRWGLAVSLQHADLVGENEFQVSFYFRPTGRIDMYASRSGRRIGRVITPATTFSFLQAGMAVAPDASSSTRIRLKDLVIETPF